VDAVTFSFSGVPVAKGRPRATARGGFARLYTPGPTRKYETAVKKVAAAVMASRKPFEGPLSVSMRFRLPIPQSATKRAKAAMASGETPHTNKPDADNCAKAVLDALSETVYLDDKQIVRLWITKVYAEKPGVDVKIEPLDEPTSQAAAA
jgi:Holliday junction resolvase RusA-like endonuclease